jgi:hypothetical protein
LPSTYWRIDVTRLDPYDPAQPKKKQRIRGGPLIDLAALQGHLGSGEFDLDNLWLATDKCEKDVQKEQWSFEDVAQMLVSLQGASDYMSSEWCQIKGGAVVACDAYAMPYDHVRKERHRRPNLALVQTYLKFSLDEAGTLSIVLVSCHT